MRRIFKTIEDHLTECTTLEKGVWVHLQSPTKEEVDGLTTRFNLDPTFLPAALDEEESARIDYDSDNQQTLIIVIFRMLIPRARAMCTAQSRWASCCATR